MEGVRVRGVEVDWGGGRKGGGWRGSVLLVIVPGVGGEIETGRGRVRGGGWGRWKGTCARGGIAKEIVRGVRR